MSNKVKDVYFSTYLTVKATGQPTQTYPSLTAGKYIRGGINNPGWKQNLKARSQAGSPMTVDVDYPFVEVSSSAGMHYSTYPHGQQQQYDFSTVGTRPPPAGFSYPNNLADWENVVRVKASSKFLKRLKEVDTQFQGGVFFGEIAPTLRMLVRPFGTLRDGLKGYFSAAKRRVRLNRPNWRSVLRDTWLEYSFGWQPLLADIKDASLAAINLYTDIRRRRISAVVTEEYELPTSVVRGYLENLMVYDVYFSNYVQYSVKYYGGIVPLPNSDLGIPSLKRIADASSFNLAAFIPTLWELIPYSFLIDYFSNIGQVLEAYSTDTSQLQYVSMVEQRISGQKIRWDYLHQKTYDYVVGLPPYLPAPYETVALTRGVGSTYGSRHKNILRWAYGSLTYPGLEFRLPMSAKQFANMGALLLGMKRM